MLRFFIEKMHDLLKDSCLLKYIVIICILLSCMNAFFVILWSFITWFAFVFIPQVDFIIGREIEVGGIYKGIVASVKEYGAFVEFNGGQHGLLHISELSHEPASKLTTTVTLTNFSWSLLTLYPFFWCLFLFSYRVGICHVTFTTCIICCSRIDHTAEN